MYGQNATCFTNTCDLKYNSRESKFSLGTIYENSSKKINY